MLKGLIIVTATLIAVSAPAKTGAAPSTKTPDAGIQFVLVPGGCFSMGAIDGNSDEKPVHTACVSSFHMSTYEITQGQWLLLMGKNPANFNQCGSDCPVEQVSWTEIQQFISRLNNMTGKSYRLPTEAEWEYACTSGGKEQRYCGGDRIDEIGWYDKNSNGSPHPVGQKKPNLLGLYDMSGNVWEWVLDWKGEYQATRQYNPTGAQWGSTRSRRGGSWQYGARQTRSRWRSSGYADDHALDLGFRLVVPSAD